MFSITGLHTALLHGRKRQWVCMEDKGHKRKPWFRAGTHSCKKGISPFMWATASWLPSRPYLPTLPCQTTSYTRSLVFLFFAWSKPPSSLNSTLLKVFFMLREDLTTFFCPASRCYPQPQRLPGTPSLRLPWTCFLECNEFSHCFSQIKCPSQSDKSPGYFRKWPWFLRGRVFTHPLHVHQSHRKTSLGLKA